MSLTVALSKGKLLGGSESLFRRAGLPFPDDPGRRLVVALDGLRFLFVKDMDVPTYVEYGVADCGIAGRDVLLESGAEVLEPADLGFGRCRLVVAAPGCHDQHDACGDSRHVSHHRRYLTDSESQKRHLHALFRQRSQKLFQHAVELLRFRDEEDVRGLVDNRYRHLRPTLANLFCCGDGPFERRIDEEHGPV